MKNTKKALLSSALALFMCFAMLLGTTFAWFTDSVTSANNIIKSGNLDVEMYWADGKADPNTTTWTDASTGAIFNSTLWEPGYTDAKHIKIANEGTLALKWQLAIVPTGTVSELADVIDVYYTVGATAATRDALGEYKGTLAEVINDGIAVGSLAADAAYTATIVLKMQETAGNEYQGLSIGSDFTIQLLATQLADESDSFGSDYDADAKFPVVAYSASDIALAIENGNDVVLAKDIVISDSLARAAASNFGFVIAKDATSSLDLNGKTITKVTANSDINGDGKFTSADNQGVFQVKGTLNVIGNGTISMQNTGDDMGWNALSAVFSVEGGTLTLGNGVTVVHNGGTAMAYAVDVNTTVGETVLNVNGATLSSSYVGVRIFNNHKTEKGIVNYNSGIIYGAKNGYDIWAQLMSAPAENAVVNFADDITYTTEAKSGTMYYVDTVAIAANANSLTAALAADTNVVLVDDITFTGAKLPDRNNYVEVYGNKTGFAQYTGVIDGNGNEVIDAEGRSSYVIVTHGGTIKNVTIKTGARGIVTYSPTADVYLDNVVVDGPGYALNSTEQTAVNMIVTNSTINGWTSLAGFAKVEFTNCKLGENSTKYWQSIGYSRDYDRLFRVYSPTFYTECEFEQGYYLDMSCGGTATLIDCTVNGVKITADNYADYITVELPEGKVITDCVVFN